MRVLAVEPVIGLESLIISRQRPKDMHKRFSWNANAPSAGTCWMLLLCLLHQPNPDIRQHWPLADTCSVSRAPANFGGMGRDVRTVGPPFRDASPAHRRLRPTRFPVFPIALSSNWSPRRGSRSAAVDSPANAALCPTAGER